MDNSPTTGKIGKRIIILGSTGSGKTTLAGQLAGVLGVPHVELDALNWMPDWTESSDEEFRLKAIQAMEASPGWVMDGNYGRIREVTWKEADTFIWLDYHILVNFWRLVRRTTYRTFTREDLWGTGNRENLWQHLFTRESLFLWLFRTHARRQRTYPAALEQQKELGKTIIRLRSPQTTNAWYESVVARIENRETS